MEVKSTWLFKTNPVGKILTGGESAGNSEIMGDGLKWTCGLILKSPKKWLSEHVPSHKQPSNDHEMGSYLAGIIEGDGCFSGKRLEIVLHLEDMGLAYRLKSWVGYGSVYKIKKKKAVKYSLTHKEGLKKILFLTNSYWVGFSKWQQIKNHGLDEWVGLKLKPPCGKVDPDSFWTAGFLDADGCLNVYLGKSLTHALKKRPQIQVRAKQKESFLPECLKACWGGSLSFTKKDLCTTWSLASVNPKKRGLYEWFLLMDSHPLQSSNKYTQYVLLRKAFLLMQHKKHLIPEGLAKIEKLQTQISLFYADLKKQKPGSMQKL
uniref:LAGLIDADG-2 homing endonuclease n=1 Tax=Ankistrodesmus falcatus TaxID=52960 RepID=A0A7L7K569_9CHLO|nr:LAGLIDADG-2 homing endonuclease [Ankistrodesmus falcatus]QMS48906.1 LAGLIDADG-2 homing endonuclease [Ankistrodesmus falcatus]